MFENSPNKQVCLKIPQTNLKFELRGVWNLKFENFQTQTQTSNLFEIENLKFENLILNEIWRLPLAQWSGRCRERWRHRPGPASSLALAAKTSGHEVPVRVARRACVKVVPRSKSCSQLGQTVKFQFEISKFRKVRIWSLKFQTSRSSNFKFEFVWEPPKLKVSNLKFQTSEV